MTRDLEVAACTPWDWERAILVCYRIWRELRVRKGGTIALDLDARTLEFADD
jgi:hypothetical protein